jgi:hypothetical protein
MAKHKMELRTFDQHCGRETEDIKREQQLKMRALQARQSKLESELADCFLNPPVALPTMASAHPDLQHQAAMTPRTAQRYSVFKMLTNGPKLSVRPLGKVTTPKKRQRFMKVTPQ